MPLSAERKAEYFERMKDLLGSYTKCFAVGVDNVGSLQLQKTRHALRGKAEVLMGKNTMMRKIIKNYLEANPGHPFGNLLPVVAGNIGFVFTNAPLPDVRDILEANRVPAPARVGAIAPCDVVVPAGPTDSGPEQTAFFQTLQIATKIVKGRIDITSPVDLLKNPSSLSLIMGICPDSFAGKFCLFIACYYSFFATGLAISPNFFFGPSTPLIITQHFAAPISDTTILFARFFAGAALSTLWAPFLIGVPFEKWAKLLMINNAGVTLTYTWGLFLVPASATHGGEMIPMMMWYSEYALGFALLAANFYVIKDVPKGPGDML